MEGVDEDETTDSATTRQTKTSMTSVTFTSAINNDGNMKLDLPPKHRLFHIKDH